MKKTKNTLRIQPSSSLGDQTPQIPEDKFRKMFNLHPGIVGISSLSDGRYLDVNLNFTKMLGWEYYEVIGKTSKELGLFEDYNQRDEMLSCIRKDGKIENFEVKLRTKTNALRIGLFSAELIDIDGNIYLFAQFNDITKRKQAEQALQTSEEKFRLLYETLTQGVFYQLADGTPADINPAGLKMFGLTREEFFRRSSYHPEWKVVDESFETIPPEKHPSMVALCTGREIEQVVGVYNPETQDYRWLSIHARPQFRDGSSMPFQVIVTMHDLTDRKKAEESLRDREQLYFSMFEKNQAVKLIIDPDNGAIIDANPAAARFYGYPVSHLKSMNICEINMLSPSEVAHEMAMALNENRNYFNFCHKLADGKMCHVEVYSSPIKILGRTFLHSIIHDISRRKAMEEEVRISEHRFRKIFEEAPIGMALVGPGFVFLKGNPAFCSFTGYTEQELLRMTIREITHPEHLSGDLESIRKLALGETQVYQTEKRYVRKNGEIIWGEAHITPILNSEGKFDHFLAMVKDISERKQMEIAVEKMNKDLYELNIAKDKFFSIIAHDLKSPFNSIIGFSDLLQHESVNLDIRTVQHYGSMINSSARHTLKLLENLLDWAKIHQGKMPYNPEPIILNQFLKAEILDLHDIARQKNIELVEEVLEPIMVNADENMLATIIRNLVTNAVKYTPRNGRVAVKAELKGPMVEVSVSDNGLGMTLDILEKLFKIESSFSTRGTENEKGTGLGLLLCKEFVEKHGGIIRADSISGEGSCFYFTIPAS